MSLNRVVFFGKSGCGKSTAISTLCHSNINCEKNFDYGLIDIGPDDQLQVIEAKTTKAIELIEQREHDSTIGYIMLIDNQDPDYLQSLQEQLKILFPILQNTALVVGVCQKKASIYGELERVNLQLRGCGLRAPAFEIDPNNESDISLLLQALLISLDEKLTQVH
ncbi:hypothetical protein [Aliikangiella sp. G2MR2-5]|uniref:hypothetical protein n=1 Tax=Aliikangiella sp. G2MR2-5 TaxID=2788943 RepID=UPI0018A91DF5|nr:hypothetical protein [Aliikangiella sp. G2MR2-5]